jgi:hypothetical protein
MGKPTGPTKREAQRVHAKRRAAERYGITLNHALHTELIAAIQTGRATFVRRQSHRVSLFDVTLPTGVTARVVYDRHRKALITVLPPEARDAEEAA